MKVLALVALILPGPALAQDALTGPEFEARTTGKTMTYGRDGQVWGREQYLNGRRVIWAFEGEACKRGTWAEAAPGLICFSYDDRPGDPECWQFFDEGGSLLAQSERAPNSARLAAVEESTKALACPGPDVGV